MKMILLRKVLLMSFYTIILMGAQLTFSGLLFANTSYGQNALKDVQVSLDFKDATLKEVFQNIERQSEFTFAYNDELLNNTSDKKITKNFSRKNMEEVLEYLSKHYSLYFKRVNETINVKKVEKASRLVVDQIEAPVQVRVSGKVISLEDGEGLPGVSILIKGTSKGTTSDIDGNYSLSVDEGSILQFSYIGFITQEITVTNQSTLNVSMEADLAQLDEVVVVGYGTQSRREVTGAIASVKSEEIEKLQIQSMDQALQGRAPGVVVTQNSGEPGGNVSVRIRGVGSFGNNEPLYVIDGFPLFNDNGRVGSAGFSDNQFNSLATLNPKDIESIEILKDASAAAIYGARAANGVVLITTKRGKAGKAKVTFSTDIGFQEVWNTPEFLTAEEFAIMANETHVNDGKTPNPEWADISSLGTGTDWVGAMFQTGLMQDYNLNVSGGNDKVQASVNLNYFDQEGIIINSDFERYSLRANLDFKANEKLKFGTSTTLSNTAQQVFRTDNFANGIFNIGLMMLPTIEEGGFVDGPALYYPQPLDNPVLLSQDIDENINVIRGMSTAFAEYEIIPGLKYKMNVGADMILSRSTRWVPSIDRGVRDLPNAQSWERTSQDVSWLIENTLNYSKSFDKHNINLLVGQTAQRSEFSSINASGEDFLNNDLRAISLSNSELRNAGGGGNRWALASYIGRFNYNYNDRYLFSASIRRDGSSRFGQDTRWGTFPSFSAGWRVTEESFLDVSWLDDLKIRASWGQLGSDRIGNFDYLTLFSANTEYTLGGQAQNPVAGVSLNRLGNPLLQWETSTQSDIGFDAAFLDGRFTLIVDYFIKDTEDLLVGVPVPSSSGVPSAPRVNAGSVRNSGLEVALGYRKSSGDFNYAIDLNFATIDNEVTSIGSGQPINGGSLNGADRFQATRTEVGLPVGYFFGFQVDGIYQTPDDLADVNDFRNPQPGDFIFRDTNGRDANGNLTGEPDGVVNQDDRTIIGSPIPDFTYGLNINLSYKNFDLNAFFQGVQGNEIFSSIKQQTMQMSYFNGSGVTNSYREILNRWTGPGTSNTVPRQSYQEVNNYNFASSFYVEDGSFMRFRNLQIGYTLPVELVGKIGVESARVYVGAQNLFTLTDYSGFDPEIGDNNQNPLNGGIDLGQYPQPRTYRVGVTASF